jgi:benzoate 4-monooxygenase
MAIVEYLLSPWVLPIAAGLLAVLYIYAHFVRFSALRGIPAPFPAQFTNLWLLSVCRRGNRYSTVDKVHKKLGKVVRIQPNHVSIADEAAINTIYGHGNGFLKSYVLGSHQESQIAHFRTDTIYSEFYDAFVSIRRGLFNTRDRAEHTRKRKLVSHTFSPKSVGQFEPYMHANLKLFIEQLDSLIQKSDKHNEKGQKEAHIDCLPWFNYLAFDIIGDLAFGAPFGMLSTGVDLAEIRESPESPPIYASAIDILNRRGEVSATLGCFPQLKPYAHWLPDPFFTKGLNAVQNLAGIAIARVKSRIENPPDIERKDLLSRLQEGKDETGERLGREELTAEALTQLIAGSDTTSNSSCALLNYLCRNPRVLEKLQAELDEAIPDGTDVPDHEMVRDLPYLSNVINETLRHHSTSGIGLPRQIPPGSPGVTIHDHFFPAGTVLSVPTYTLHHSTEIWGPDAEEFRPERWNGMTQQQKDAFIPFSHGPRSCVGRNVAEMEMKLIAATWARRYAVKARQGPMETREGFLRKPLALEIALSRR